MPKASCLGNCEKRKIRVNDNQLCDWFELRKKPKRYHVMCAHCKHFTKIDISKENPGKENKNQDSDKIGD
jgi:hypothetical protein